jgi:hypothetical protein
VSGAAWGCGLVMGEIACKPCTTGLMGERKTGT